MTKAIVLHNVGGPENFSWETVPEVAPGAGEIALRHTAIGVNYIDTYMRSGLYPVPLPGVLGQQGTGVVTALGEGVSGFAIGQRVAYGSAPIGAYAQARVVPAKCVVAVPDTVSDVVCAANLLRGMTAEYLLFRTTVVKAGDIVLVHAAAGATGVLLSQWARALGARVIGTVGSMARAALASAAGAELVLEYGDPDFVERVVDFTDGRRCDVVYDSVGKDTFDVSMACVKVRGMLVVYGNGSGKPDPLDVLRLAAQGSIFLTRPRLDHYTRDAAETIACAERFFAALESGALTPRPITEFPLPRAADAHRHLENRDCLTTPVLVND